MGDREKPVEKALEAFVTQVLKDATSEGQSTLKIELTVSVTRLNVPPQKTS